MNIEDEQKAMNRKIVQLVTKGNVVFALCTDGTVWKLARNINKGYCAAAYEWERLTDIPQ